MSFLNEQICLAHYCDTHGPTPLMTTEGLSVGCSSCYVEDSLSTRRPSTSSRSIYLPGGPDRASAGRRTTSSASEREDGVRRADLQASGDRSSSAIETPPDSPRVAHLQHDHSPRRDSSFRRTYDENDRKRAIPCENCALTLPKRTKEVSLSATSENTRRNSRIDTNSPILRTRIPYERVAVPVDASPPNSPESSEELEGTGNSSKPELQPRGNSQSTASGVVTSSSNSSFGSTTTHTHHIDYTSTHEPLSPTSFSIVRQSCLRTLSCETLPPNTTPTSSNPSTIPSTPFINNPFYQSPTSSISSTSSIASTSGGPIFFGDPLAGYTTAYIFRIPDPNARGRRRVYALMALSTHHERLAMKSFSFLGSAFRELAAWIQGLADMELERSESVHSPRADSMIGMGGGISSSALSSGSFLSGRSRGPDGKFAGVSLRARGLAELVGLPDFFLELHARFVRLLVELNILLGA